MTKAKKESPAAFARQAMMEKPGLTLEEIQSKWDAANKGKYKFVGEDIHTARYQIKKKYGTPIDKLPPPKNGKPDVEALARVLAKKQKNAGVKRLQYFMRVDGIHLDEETARRIIDEAKGNKAVADYVASGADHEPAPAKGPRARFISKKGRRPGSKVDGRRKASWSQEELTQMENYLDILVVMAHMKGDQKMLELFRAARRPVIAKLAD